MSDYTKVGYGYEVTAYAAIDKRLVLTKAEMLTAHEDYSLPDFYFAYCPDDNQWYEYKYEREEAEDFDPETGYYRVMPMGLVKDVRIEGISILDSEGIADFEFPVKDVMVNGASVVEDKVANIDLSDFQKKLTPGNGIELTSEGVISVDSEAIPKKTSDLINDNGFIDSEAQNLKYYYTKDEVYTQKEVDDLVEPLKDGVVQDVLVNGTSVVTDNVAHVNVIDDVKVDGTSVVDRGIANISLAHKQDKLAAGRNIDITNNVISVEGLKTYSAGYGLNLNNDGQFSVDTTRVATLDKIPSNVSQLANDAGFITRAVANLQNYYLKAETYTKDEVNNLISSMAGGVELVVANVLPVTGQANTIYLLRRAIDSNVYDQYVWFNNSWVQVGSTEVDLSQYYKKQEVDALLSDNYQRKLTNGAGIALNNNFISVDMGSTLTTTGNKLDVKTATPYQAGVVSYDDDTIKMNAQGRLYATASGGQEYVAGPNVQINGNVISATDTTYKAGDAIQIDSNNNINVLYDDETIHQNRKGELYMDAVPIEAGRGIDISSAGVISTKTKDIAEDLDLASYQPKLIAGNNIVIDQATNVISATGGGSGGGANWGEIGGTISNQNDLSAALAGKQRVLVAGTGITIENLSSTQARISAEGGSGKDVYFGDVKGSPYDNDRLSNALDKLDNEKQDKIGPDNKLPASNVSGLAPVATSGSYDDLSDKPVIGGATLTIKQGAAVKGTFNANANVDKVIEIDAGVEPVAPGNGQLTINRNNQAVANFKANQSTNVIANIKVPTFSYNSTTGVLTITDN